MLLPREEVSWQEWWYPVHGLGDGFEYATKDLAIQTARKDDRLQLRIIATGKFPGTICTVSQENRELLKKTLDLSPKSPQVLTLSPAPQVPVNVIIEAKDGAILASFVTPLPISKVSPPAPSKFARKPDEQLTVEEKYLKGRKYDLATDRKAAREYY